MAWSDSSTWNPTTSQYGSKPATTVDSTGLTAKQQDMSTARNPMNFNQQNVVTPTGEKAPPLPQQQDIQKQQAAQANVQEMQKKLGNATYSVQGLVNKFLTQGTEQVKLAGATPQYKFNQATGQNEVSNITPSEADVSSVVAEKMGQIEEIKQAAAPYYSKDTKTGKWEKKSLPTTLRELNHYDSLDSTGKAQVDQLIGLASMINEYESRGQGGSAEAVALQQQLQQLDKNGIVSGMYKAIDDYNKFAGKAPSDKGMTWYGDTGSEGLSLQDILNMDQTKVESEIKNAIASSQGIFGGDYELGLKRQLDTESAEAKAGQQQELEYRNQLNSAAKTYFGDIQAEITKNATAIQDAFKQAAPTIISGLKADTSSSGRAALEFFTQLSDADPTEFSDLINSLLYDPSSGLQRSQRAAIEEYIGSIVPGVTSKGGKIGSWLNELSTQGYVDVDGTKVELNAEEKYNVLNMLKNNNTEGIKNIFENAFMRANISFDDALKKMSDTKNAPAAIAGFADSMVKSLSTFALSKTADAVRKSLNISDLDWNNISQEERNTVIADRLKQNPKLLMESVQATATQQLTNFKTQTAALKENLNNYVANIDKKKELITGAINNAMAQKNQVTQTLQGYLTDIFSRGYSSDNVKKYNDYFQKNADYFKAMGKSPADLQTAATALSARDTLLSLSHQNPELWNAIKNPQIEPYVALNANAAVANTLINPSQSMKILNEYIGALTSNSGNILDQVMVKSPYYNSIMGGINASISQANTALKTLNDTAGSAKTNLDNINTIESELGKRVFSPQEISNLALQVGHAIESSAVDYRQIQPTDLARGYFDMGKYDSTKVSTGDLITANIDALKAQYAPESVPTQFGALPSAVKGPDISIGSSIGEADISGQIPEAVRNVVSKNLPNVNTAFSTFNKEPNLTNRKALIAAIDQAEADAIAAGVSPNTWQDLFSSGSYIGGEEPVSPGFQTIPKTVPAGTEWTFTDTTDLDAARRAEEQAQMDAALAAAEERKRAAAAKLKSETAMASRTGGTYGGSMSTNVRSRN